MKKVECHGAKAFGFKATQYSVLGDDFKLTYPWSPTDSISIDSILPFSFGEAFCGVLFAFRITRRFRGFLFESVSQLAEECVGAGSAYILELPAHWERQRSIY